MLHKSAIVLLVASWEAFVEDLADVGLEFMIKKGKSHDVFPKHVLERVAQANSGINAWKLAGNGWQGELRGNLKAVLAKTTGTLNTPKTKQINELFSKTIGLENLSSNWGWPGASSKTNSDRLDRLVGLRGTIAHRVRCEQSVRKSHVMKAGDLVLRLAICSSNAVRSHIHQLVNLPPWPEYELKG